MISRRRLLSTTAATAALAAVPAPATAATEQAARAAAGRARVTGPTVEYVHQPLGLGTRRPRLSWPVAAEGTDRSQSAYQVRVATPADRLGAPDVWHSGKVVSSQ